MTATNLRKPPHNACTFCGRNAHKVAVRFDRCLSRRGEWVPARVDGFCPSCMKIEMVQGIVANGTVLYDLRARA